MTPSISVLILNYNGLEHLRSCLPTVFAQTYDPARFTVEVIDNGSTDGSVAFVKEHFPAATIRRLGRNAGFAGPYDTAIRASHADFVALLNNDTRVEPTWLAELVSAADRHEAHAVASRILDWDGQRIDFVGGQVSFLGHAWQRHYGESAALPERETPLLFACGGSMLLSRQAYLDAGGFDRDFFAYFEDVDLGWRMSILGYHTVLAPRAVTFHRLHGTAGRVAFAQRLRLYERNALAMIYKNYEEAHLERVLPAAVALSLLRGLPHGGIDSRLFAPGAASPSHVDLSARTLVHLLALEDFARQLPALRRKRADIQSRRKRSDHDVADLFGGPFRFHEGGQYEAVGRALVEDFNISGVFTDGATRHFQVPALPAPLTVTDPPPTVSIVILTALGATHLPECLSSLRAQSFPADRFEVIVVDNGSAEDPTAAAESLYPGIRVVRLPNNLGFAVGNNAGARVATGDYLAFLNDDTRVHQDWLQELVNTAISRGAVSVGSRILSWDGERIDFVAGLVNCEGKGFQVDVNAPAEGRHTTEVPILFACGAAILIRRDIFQATGGWDEGTFAYYEDVELGWRMWLMGHEVWSSPASIVYHKHHGTSGRWPAPPKARLLERNSLRMLYTLLEDGTLARVLPAALLLSADRVLLSTGFARPAPDPVEESGRTAVPPRRRIEHPWRGLRTNLKGVLRNRGVNRQRPLMQNVRRLGLGGAWEVLRILAGVPLHMVGPTGRLRYDIEHGFAPLALDGMVEPIPSSAAASLAGLHEFLVSIPELQTRRAAFQAARRRSDREILSRFGKHWTSPCAATRHPEHAALQRVVLEAMGVTRDGQSWEKTT